MSGFWEDFVEESAPSPPPPSSPQAVAPGQWWQRAAQIAPGGLQQQPQATAANPGTSTGEYRPETAESIMATEKCPRCHGDNYCEILMEAGTQRPAAQVKKCFDCRYPSSVVPRPDAGGSSGKGKLARQTGTAGQGSWGGEATWAAAQKVV